MFEDLNAFTWILTLLSTAALILEILALLSVIHALQHVRSSQATVAWTVGLITFPLLTLPLYWLLSRNRFAGYREAIREIGVEHSRSVQSVQDELHTTTYARTTRQQTALDRLADTLDTPISDTEEAQLLIDGQQFFKTAFDEISLARRYVYASFYILRDDQLGRQFANALIAKANQGLQVRVVFDEVGSLRLSDNYLQKLREAGVDIRPFHTQQGWTNRFQINFRNHRKLIVIDGHTALVGGLNIGNEYLGTAANLPSWRDTGILFRGKAARKIQAVFAGDYYWAARKDLSEADWTSFPDGLPQKTPAKDHPTPSPREQFKQTSESFETHRMAICATGPADMRPRASMMFAEIANSAHERLWICTPYLVPDESTLVALHGARARGVDVRLLIPDRADHWAVYLAGIHYARLLAEAHIRVHRYTAGFMHQKCILVDNSLALIGSTNLDQRSLHLNFELMVATEDPHIIGEVSAMIQNDLNLSVEDHPTRWWLTNIGTAFARLFSPIL